MPKFSLIPSEEYLSNVKSLPVHIKEKLTRKLPLMEQDPWHPSLDSHLWNKFEGQKIYRTDIDDRYRLVWQLVNSTDVILMFANIHKIIDSLEKNPRLPNFMETANAITFRDEPQTDKATAANDHHGKRLGQPKGLFSWVPEGTLRLIGIPESELGAVENLTDPNDIYLLTIPSYARQVLLEIYTDPKGYQEKIFKIPRLLYRASAKDLEQYAKGKIKSLMLDLSPEQDRIVRTESTGVNLIKGVAGSGKSTVGMYRALHLAKQRAMFSVSRILFLTYTDTLARVVKQLFDELQDRDEESWEQTIIVSTFREWILEYVGNKITPAKYDPNIAETCLAKVIGKLLPEKNDTPRELELKGNQFLYKEISEVLKGRDITSLEQYKNTERVGRGRPIDGKTRELVWQIFLEYKKELENEGILDEADLYLVAQQIYEQDPKFPVFREVVVDEAQDLPPIALKLAAAMAGGGSSQHLTLLADPSQSIYYRGIPWKDGGIELHGSRVKNLKKNYRNTQQILEVSWSLSEADPSGSLDESVSPDKATKLGPKPRWIITLGRSNQDLKKLKELIYRIHDSGSYRYGDIAVLARRNEDVTKISNYLSHANLLVCHFRDDRFDILENDIKVITINSAKGLEFPIVFLMKVDEGRIPRKLDHIRDPADLQQGLREERQLLYVGMTRASEMLYIMSTHGAASRFLSDIPKELLQLEIPAVLE